MDNHNSLDRTRLSSVFMDLPLTPIGMVKKKKVTEITNPKKKDQQTVNSRTYNQNENLYLNLKPKLKSKKSEHFKLFTSAKTCQEPPESALSSFQKDCSGILNDSVFSDIEDSSFVEFPPQKIPQQSDGDAFYYTCLTNNETQYSTSSKKPATNFGFRQYVDKMNELKDSKSLVHQTCLNSHSSRPNQILCSTAINDTHATLDFPDISSLSLVENRLKKPQVQRRTYSQECITISDSDEEASEAAKVLSKCSNLNCSSDETASVSLSRNNKKANESWTTEDISIISTQKKTVGSINNDCSQSNNTQVLKWITKSPFKFPSSEASYERISEEFPGVDLNLSDSNSSVPIASETIDSIKALDSNQSVLTIGKYFVSPTQVRPRVIRSSSSERDGDHRTNPSERLQISESSSMESLPDIPSLHLHLSNMDAHSKSRDENTRKTDDDLYYLQPVPDLPSSNSISDVSDHSFIEFTSTNTKCTNNCRRIVDSSASENEVVEVSDKENATSDFLSRIRKKLGQTSITKTPTASVQPKTSSSEEDTPNWFSKKKKKVKTRITKKQTVNEIGSSKEHSLTKILPRNHEAPSLISTTNKATSRVRIPKKYSEISDDNKSESSEEDEPPKWFTKTKKSVVTRIKRPTPHSGLSSSIKPTSFMLSLSHKEVSADTHLEAIPYIKSFRKHKTDLMNKLFSMFNKEVFSSKLSEDMNLKWNGRMTKTAGYCYLQIDKSKSTGKNARIELSSKVITSADRLRDTLIHEMCHAAAWIISGYKCGHGKLWKAWASLAMKAFPDLPVISRCHAYAVECKYTYRCVKCHYEIGRHSKSLDTEKKVCGFCYGKFELVVNGPSSSQSSQEPSTPRTPGPFAMFVKENYSSVKKSAGTNSKHADVMKALSKEFSKLKTNI